MDLEKVLFGWIILDVMETNPTSRIVITQAGGFPTAHMMKTWEWTVKTTLLVRNSPICR